MVEVETLIRRVSFFDVVCESRDTYKPVTRSVDKNQFALMKFFLVTAP